MSKESGSNLRDHLSKVESLLNSGISFLKVDDKDKAVRIFTEARRLYENLVKEVNDDELKLLFERRIKGRIDRILRGLKIELFEELDEHGQKTGQQEVSTLAHLKGMRHSSVNVLVFNRQSKTLLQLRAPTAPVFPGKWTFAASGHVANYQTPKDAIVAEMIEELSVQVTSQEERKTPESIREFIEINNDNEKWLRLYPKPQKLNLIGRENGYDGYLLLAEFVYLNEVEKQSLISATSQALKKQAKYGVERILYDIDDSAKTFLLFSYSPKQRIVLEQIIDEIKKKTNILAGMITDNVEKKSLYTYHLDENEELVVEEIIKLKKKTGKPIDEGLVSGFQWVSFDETIENFNENPNKYTDAFVPFLSDQTIVNKIKKS